MKSKSTSEFCIVAATWWIIIFALFAMTGCAKQTPPAPITPTINITYTDNSQMVVGDGNKSDSSPETPITQETTPTVETSADETTSNAWIYWLIITMCLVAAGYIGWRKFLK